MENNFYRSSKTRSYIAIGLLAAVLFCSFLFIIFNFIILAAPDWNIDLGEGNALNVGIGLTGITAVFKIPLFILTVIFFLIWEYRAFSNLSALKA